MLIIPYVCAEFRDKAGNTLFRIRPEMLRSMQEVPDAIEQDRLFDLLVADGSIKTPESVAQKKLLEQDPMNGMAADGRSAVIAGGDQEGGAEVNGVFTAAASGRSKDGETLIKRAVRGTVAPIEVADKEIVADEEKPRFKPVMKTAKTTKAEDKPAEEKSTENNTQEKPAK